MRKANEVTVLAYCVPAAAAMPWGGVRRRGGGGWVGGRYVGRAGINLKRLRKQPRCSQGMFEFGGQFNSSIEISIDFSIEFC